MCLDLSKEEGMRFAVAASVTGRAEKRNNVERKQEAKQGDLDWAEESAYDNRKEET